MTAKNIFEVVTEKDVHWIARILRNDPEVIYNLERISGKLGLPISEFDKFRMATRTDGSGSFGFLTKMVSFWIRKEGEGATFSKFVDIFRQESFYLTADKLNSHLRPEICFDVQEDSYFFSGRSQEVQQIHEELINQKSSDSIFVISGMGGIGKTSLSIHYAWMYKSFYSNVIWINGETKATITDSFERLYNSLGLDDPVGSIDREQRISSIYAHIGSSHQTLFIFDNVGQYRDIVESLPNRSPKRAIAHILVTSRNRKWNERTHVMNLNVFSEQESVQFLSNYLKLKTDEEIQCAVRLSRVLENLPLAIKQAGAFIKMQKITYNRTNLEEMQIYISEFDTNVKCVLDFEYWTQTPDKYEKTTFNTWHMTLAQISDQNPLATYIMELMSFMNGKNIPTELFMFIRHQDYFKGWKRFVQKIRRPDERVNKLRIVDALLLLSDHSMIHLNLDRSVVSVHGLVQRVIQERFKNKLPHKLNRCVKLFQICLQSNELKNKVECKFQADILALYIKAQKLDRKYKSFLESLERVIAN